MNRYAFNVEQTAQKRQLFEFQFSFTSVYKTAGTLPHMRKDEYS